MAATTRQLTLRLPPELYSKSARMAKRHKMSLNELARRGLEALTAREAMAELKAAYDLLGTGSEESVEHFLPAFSEVICGDE